jgi:RND family efflux transporter MFP subunit
MCARPRLSIALFLAGTALSAGCRPANQFVPPPPPKVTVARPIERALNDTIEFTGTTKSFATVELRARAEGFLQSIHFVEGKTVQAGELLFTIDKAPYELALESARAEAEKAQAAMQLAEANLQRTLQLQLTNAASQQQVDVDRAQQATAAANVNAALAAVRQAVLNLSYTEVRAPITGRIGRHLIDVGNLVHVEQTLLAVIETIDPMYVYFYVGERDLLRFMEMIRARELPDPNTKPPEIRLQLENETGFPHVGHLDFRELGVDPNTGTILRRAAFDNPNSVLIPGLFVRLQAPIGEPVPRLTVERRAIGYDQRGDYVLVVNAQNIVEFRLVRLGLAVGERQVVLEGVTKDDRVIVNGVQRARPGSAVDPSEAAAPTTAPAATPTAMPTTTPLPATADRRT